MMGMRYDGTSDDEHNMYDDLFYNFPFNAGGQKSDGEGHKPKQSFIVSYRLLFIEENNIED